MPNSYPDLTVVVATPLSEELCALIEHLEPRVRVLRNQSLLPPMRWVGDHGGDPSWSRTPAQQSQFEALVDSADALYGIPDESPAALARTAAANPKLRWVHTMAAGGGGQIKAAGLTRATLERLALTSSAGVHAQSLSEFALFGVLAGAKNLPRLLSQKKAGVWGDRWMMGQLSEQTVLVLGLGTIGRRTAAALSGLGVTVWGTSRHESQVDGVSRIVRPSELADVVGQVDAIVVALPGTETTEHLINTALLARVTPGLTLVSVGRGTVIDERALVEALEDGRVGFAALDVFASEPLAADSALWSLPNVVISPHTAALTAAEDRLIAELFSANATRLLDGEPLINPINKHEFY